MGKSDLTEYRLHLVRHGESLANKSLQWQGWGDAELTELGCQQARAAGILLSNTRFAQVWSSDRLRTQRTMSEILSQFPNPLPHQTDPRLRERFYGGFENQTTPELLQLYPNGLFDPTSEQSRMDWRPVAGESLHEVLERLYGFVHDVGRKIRAPGESVLVVTHGNILRLVHMACLGLSEPDVRLPVNAGCLIVDVLVESPAHPPTFRLVAEPEWHA